MNGNEDLRNQGVEAANDPSFNEMLQDLGAVDSEESGEAEITQSPETELDTAAAVAMVEMGIIMSEQYIASASGLPFEFDEKSKNKFLDASGPLMQKHGLTWLAWFEQWKEELVFSGAALGLYLSSRKQLMKLQLEHMGASANDGEKTTDTTTAAA